MSPQIDVKFERMLHDPSVEASIQRWVDRLGWTNVEIARAAVSIERTGWRRISVDLTIVLADGRSLTAAMSHTDVYVAVADVFRELRKWLLGAPAAFAGRRLAFTA